MTVDYKIGKRLQDAGAAALRRMEALTTRLDVEDRDRMTAAEQLEFNKLDAEAKRCAAGLADYHRQRDEELRTMRVTETGNPNSMAYSGSLESAPSAKWIDRNTGEEIELLSPSQRMPVRSGKPRLHLGRALVGAITGRWAPESEAERLAMGGNTNIGGGVLVNDELSADIIDLARAQAVLFRAGAKTIPMTSDTLKIAKIAADPVLQNKGENVAFSGTQVTFGAIGMMANTIGNYVVVSRELVEDAPNAADLIQQTLAKALAVALDVLGLTGSGSATLEGLTTRSDIGNTGSVGTLAWSHLQTAVTGIRKANLEPNAYVCSPTTQNRLASLTTGDGTNAAKMWLPPPANVAQLEQLTTTSCPDGTIVCGDFTKAIFGIRQEAMIEVTKEGINTFQSHQLGIKITWRGDFNLTLPLAFYSLTGISG